jgi:ActR/RegA family two-component response regulator
MGDTDFKWRDALKFIEKKLTEYEIQRRTPKLLFVDDDEADWIIFKRQTDGFVCEVEWCHDPEKAMQLIKSGRYDFVFVDERMPKLAGLEIIKASLPHPVSKFISITGFRNPEVADRALKFGALFAPKDSLSETLEIFLRHK